MTAAPLAIEGFPEPARAEDNGALFQASSTVGRSADRTDVDEAAAHGEPPVPVLADEVVDVPADDHARRPVVLHRHCAPHALSRRGVAVELDARGAEHMDGTLARLRRGDRGRGN